MCKSSCASHFNESSAHSLQSSVVRTEIGVQVAVRLTARLRRRLSAIWSNRGGGARDARGLAKTKPDGLHTLVNIGIGIHRPALRRSASDDEAGGNCQSVVASRKLAGTEALVDVTSRRLRPKNHFDRCYGFTVTFPQFGIRRLCEV